MTFEQIRLVSGKTEQPLMSHDDSLRIKTIMDEVRRQIGVRYDADDWGVGARYVAVELGIGV